MFGAMRAGKTDTRLQQAPVFTQTMHPFRLRQVFRTGFQGMSASEKLQKAVTLHQHGQLDQADRLYREVLALQPENADALHLTGMVALQQGRAAEAVPALRRAIAINANVASYHFHHALALQGLNDWNGAVDGYGRALVLKPDDADTYNNMGNALAALGKLDKAEASFRKAIMLQPGHASAHCGLGAALWRLGRHAQAVTCYQTALSRDPHHAGALVNLGNAHWETGALQDAQALLTRALALRPQDCDILNSLAALCLARGDSGGAGDFIRRSLGLRETATAKKLFVQLARRADWDGSGAQSRQNMTRALVEPWDRPGTLAHSAAQVIHASSAIGPLLAQADSKWPRPMSLAQLLGDAGFAPLADDALLLALLTSTPNMDLALERFLTLLRSAMLRELAQDTFDTAKTMLFASALAQQCFINEYVFACSDDELALAHALLEKADAVTPMRILLAACYFPLHGLPGAARLLQTSWPQPVEIVLTQQLREPQEEQRLRAGIPRLTRIEDKVSLLVQDQYEENPYPRWVRQPPGAPDTIQNFIHGKFPLARFDRDPGRTLQDVLIAGCGTGQRSIAMAQKFGAQNMLAVDLSLTSLCYARRKSDELGLAIAYGQADLLEIGQIERQFDLMESLGVLHHLADPWEGWRRLLTALRPGGFMLLGLYSQSARRPIAQSRAQIREQGLGPNPADIRQYRQTLIQSGTAHASILTSEDFFSLSACRDLLFHVQEEPTTIAALAHFIESQGLHFLGFELDDAVLASYRNRFPQDKAATDLASWEAFEADHPGLFGGMYVFWIQKPARADAGQA
jgi:Flp pilus assembly protein TadD/SAM-dependent methyltransferase